LGSKIRQFKFLGVLDLLSGQNILKNEL
jgi:hypothetical protein